MQFSKDPFVISRIYDAPRELVWKAWTEAERLKQWWGPKGFDLLSCKVDLRPGGLFHYGLRTPDGMQFWGRFVYREIVPPERLVFILSFADEAAGMARNPWNADWPLEMHSTVTFEDQGGGKTLVTVRWTPHEATEAGHRAFDEGRDSMRGGWSGTLEQLTTYLREDARS